MSVTDLISDQLTVMRNAIMADKKSATIKRSSIIESIVGIMKKEGFIDDFKVITDNKQGKIKVYFKTLEDGTPVMETMERVSTPGRRQYIPAKQVKRYKGGVGITILSTNRGLLTDKEAMEQHVGGEIICNIW